MPIPRRVRVDVFRFRSRSEKGKTGGLQDEKVSVEMMWRGCWQETEETSRWVFTARLRPQFRMPAVRNAPELRSQHDAAPPVQLLYPGERRAAAAMPLPESP